MWNIFHWLKGTRHALLMKRRTSFQLLRALPPFVMRSPFLFGQSRFHSSRLKLTAIQSSLCLHFLNTVIIAIISQMKRIIAFCFLSQYGESLSIIQTGSAHGSKGSIMWQYPGPGTSMCNNLTLGYQCSPTSVYHSIHVQIRSSTGHAWALYRLRVWVPYLQGNL